MKDTRFKPGNSGRPTGSKNKVVIDIREKVTDFITKNWDNAQSHYDLLEPKDKLVWLEKLMNYSIPKLQAISSSIQFEDLTDEQLDEIIERLKN